jgi:hypothetical protein
MILLYIDPGAGSMVIQAVLAGLLAVPFFFRTQIGRATRRLRSWRNGGGADVPGDADHS